MSLLYEHYVYGLLHEAYDEKVIYQAGGMTGKPDFLYKSKDFKAILDTKYIPKYEKDNLSTDVIRQLSGYSRDLGILKRLEYKDNFPIVPCVIIYPEEGTGKYNPFKNKELKDLFVDVKGLLAFSKISVPVPTIVKGRSIKTLKCEGKGKPLK